MNERGWIRFHTSNLCNFSCPHCHVFEAAENKLPAQIMSLDVMKRAFLDYMAWIKSNGLSQVTISLYGGEPLIAKKSIVPFIKEIGNSFQEVEIFWILNSNGSLVTETDIELFSSLKNFEFHLSIDGPENVQSISRPWKTKKRSFPTVVETLKRLRAQDIPVQLNSYLHPENQDYLKFLVELSKENSIKQIYFDLLYTDRPQDLELIWSKYSEFYSYSLANRIPVSGPWRYFQDSAGGRNHFEARKWAIDILVDGTFFMSVNPLHKTGSLPISEMKSFLTGDRFLQVRAKTKHFFENKCSGCALSEQCFGGAISQTHYHLGKEVTDYMACGFFRKIIPIVSQPFQRIELPGIELWTQMPLPESHKFLMQAASVVETLQATLGFSLNRKIRFTIFQDRDSFKLFRMPGHYPEWVNGFVYSDQEYCQIGTAFGNHLVHEIAHLYFRQANIVIPKWFEEGLCEFLEKGPLTFDEVERLSNTQLISFNQRSGQEDIFNWDTSPRERNMVYLQARAFIEYIFQDWEDWNAFYHSLRTSSVDQAFERIFRLTVSQAEEKFHRSYIISKLQPRGETTMESIRPLSSL